MNKNVSIFVGCMFDEVINLIVNDVTYSAPSVNALIAEYPTVFSGVLNPNGQTDLGFELPIAASFVTGTFKSHSTNNIYYQASDEYVLGQPKTRCPQCP